MSKIKCPQCGDRDVSITLYTPPDRDVASCNKCGYTALAEDFPKQSIFDHITESLEALAEKLVYCAEYKTIRPMYLEGKGGIVVAEVWKSTIIPDATFSSEAEAIVATVAKLKEVKK